MNARESALGVGIGVVLAANKRIDEKNTRIEQLETEIAELKKFASDMIAENAGLRNNLDKSKAAHRSCAETAIRIHAELKAEIEELKKEKGGEG